MGLVRSQIRLANHQKRPLFLIIIATKPCFIKLASLILACSQNSIPFLAIETGQHYDPELTNAKNDLKYQQLIAIFFNIRGSLLTRNKDLIRSVQWLTDLLQAEGLTQQALPVISGDTSTAGLLPIFWYLTTGIRSIHVEAGLRSSAPELDWKLTPSECFAQQKKASWFQQPDEPFPEGIDSCLASVGSQLFFAPVAYNYDNLMREGYSATCIITVGSLSSDAVKLAQGIVPEVSIFKIFPFLTEAQWLRVDLHRRENLTLEKIIALLNGLGQYSRQGGKVVLVLSNALKSAISYFKLHDLLENKIRKDGLKITELWPSYLHVIEFIGSKQCLGILTDSGGLQEEACILNVPCLTLRFSTDRPETVLDTEGNLLLPPINEEFISRGIAQYFSQSTRLKNTKSSTIYGEDVGKKIAATLMEFKPGGPAIKNNFF